MEKFVIKFKFEKATKNAVRFQEVEVPGKPQVVGSLYVQKWAVGDVQEIQVTVEAADNGGKKEGKK